MIMTEQEFEAWLREWVATPGPIVAFWPSTITKQTGVPENKVVEKLMVLCEEGKLVCEWHAICLNCGHDIKVGTGTNNEQFDGKELECQMCGEEFEASAYLLSPVFRFLR